jgi:hypothetical protein
VAIFSRKSRVKTGCYWPRTPGYIELEIDQHRAGDPPRQPDNSIEVQTPGSGTLGRGQRNSKREVSKETTRPRSTGRK